MRVPCSLLSHKALFAAALLAVWLAFGGAAVRAEEMVVSGAASLTNAFGELRALYEKKHPGLTVHTNYAASNPLLRQMQEGAPVDVFASADQETMDKAEKAGLIDPATRRDFVSNKLVLIVPRGGKKPAGMADLSTCRRIAVGNPDSVPAGRYARESLTRAGLWEALAPRLILGNSVRQVLDYVARGEVDAGFVYATDARQMADKVEVALVAEGHKPVLYPVAVATTGKNAAQGKAFVDFLLSPEGEAVLARYGFSRP